MPRLRALVAALTVLQLSALRVAAHGAVVDPPPRNAVDRDVLPWSGPVPKHPPNVDKPPAWCPVAGKDGQISGQNAQACFWFSNGCAVGCPKCDGNARGPIPGTGNKSATNPPTPWGRNKVGPNGVVCQPGEGTGVKPTMCDPKLRSINTNAECGGPNDWYYYSPWRYPGYAPIIDPCGVAGGHRPPIGPFGGVYYNTSHASLGDYGSVVLPVMSSNTTWKAGSTVRVSWTIEANASAARVPSRSVRHPPGPRVACCRAACLTLRCFAAAWRGVPIPSHSANASTRHRGRVPEDAFSVHWEAGDCGGTPPCKMYMTFITGSREAVCSLYGTSCTHSVNLTGTGPANTQGLRWGGGPAHGGAEISFDATEVTEGVVPKGYAWRRNPIPITGGHAGLPGPVNVPSFQPPCKNHSWCIDDQDGRCSGIHCAPEIVDFVKIPSDVPAGEYVLGWRWDCEVRSYDPHGAPW